MIAMGAPVCVSRHTTDVKKNDAPSITIIQTKPGYVPALLYAFAYHPEN